MGADIGGRWGKWVGDYAEAGAREGSEGGAKLRLGLCLGLGFGLGPGPEGGVGAGDGI